MNQIGTQAGRIEQIFPFQSGALPIISAPLPGYAQHLATNAA